MTILPKFPSLEKEMENRITEFYNNASVLPINKYFVGLWGENIQSTIRQLEASTKGGNKEIYSNILKTWMSTHIDDNKTECELKWTCNAVNVPIIKPKINTDFRIDSNKSITYPLIQGHEGTGTVTLTIVENRQLLMYQFFNALMNSFYNTKVMKPKSSFQKLGLYVVIMNGDYIPLANKKQSNRSNDSKNSVILEEYGLEINTIPLQVYEFNSAVIKSISDIQLSYDANVKNLTFKVEFECPNLFQSSFATTTLKGMVNNTSDRSFKGFDNRSIDEKTGLYIPTVFETSPNDLKSLESN